MDSSSTGGRAGDSSRVDSDKAAAAEAAVALVTSGMLVGLGSGSTSAHAVRALGVRVAAGLSIKAVSTSSVTRTLAAAVRIPLVSLEDIDAHGGAIDLTIDGADEIDPQLRLIKGAGGALLYEKIVAASSRRMVIIADVRKRVDKLGGVPLPIEVVPFGASLVLRRLRALGATAALRVGPGGAPFVTDGGHHIYDARIPGLGDDPAAIAATLDAIPGLVEHGLFLGFAEQAIIAQAGEVVVMNRPQ